MQIENEDADKRIEAIPLTDEFSLLLLQEGIDPSTVNKLIIPAGLSSIGTFTILCLLDKRTEYNNIAENFNYGMWARVGAMRWRLSGNLRVRRFSRNMGSWHTLAVISVDDWRYDLNFGNSGTSMKTDTNVYKDDFSIVDGEEVTTEEDGVTPVELAGLEDEKLHLQLPTNEMNNPEWGNPHPLNDPLNCWDYKTQLSPSVLADKVLSACGHIAIPIPEWNPLGADVSPDWYTAPETGKLMSAVGIGATEWVANEYWEMFANVLHKNGSLSSPFGTTKGHDQRQEFGGIDEVDNYFDTSDDGGGQDTVIRSLRGANDATRNIPRSITVQFPAKDSSGRIILYQLFNVKHKQPEVIASGDENIVYSDEIVTITDHIKSKVSVEAGDLGEHGISTIEIIPAELEDVLGLSEERVDLLIKRALHISRMYYSRWYAGTGKLMANGFHLVHPYPGMQRLEYGMQPNRVPYTLVSGELHDERYGFKVDDVAKNAIVSSGGAMLSRPDGMIDFSIQGGASNDLLCQITGTGFEGAGACFPQYSIKRLSDGKAFTNLVPTDREIPNMCYEPVNVDDLVLFAWIATEPGDEPTCNDEGCNYIFIAGEEVQTQECQ
tara:strand:- start:3570 stop:5387 length:1818 start_codon:yes stop_codon:yes gene_type:complete